MRQPERHDPLPAGNWTSREAYLLAVVCLLAGLGIGYLLRGPSSTPVVSAAVTPATAPSTSAANPTDLATTADVQAAPLKMALTTDPKNFALLVQLGNLYYDKQVFPPAIEYYKRALEFQPNDINVRTDLGTAYWYSGFADNAVTEYEKVLKLQPDYQPTLMNLGIVRLEGLKDARGAIVAWEKLLAVNPQHPERQRVLALIEQAKGQLQ